MDVSKIQLGGEWLELEAVSENIGRLRFKVRPSSTKEQLQYAKAIVDDREKIIDEISKLVIEWSLEKDGEPLPCTDENKAAYMPHLIGVAVKVEGPAENQSVGSQIILFSNEFGNFVKN